MNDAEFEHERQRILAVDNRWRELLGLDRWWLLYEYDRAPDGGDSREGAHHWRTIFTTYPHWEYCEATVVCYMPSVAGLDDDDLERFLLHEYCHILVSEMRDAVDDRHEERVVTLLAEAFQKIRAAGEKEGFARLGGSEGAD